jgi:hypothetical protein
VHQNLTTSKTQWDKRRFARKATSQCREREWRGVMGKRRVGEKNLEGS